MFAGPADPGDPVAPLVLAAVAAAAGPAESDPVARPPRPGSADAVGSLAGGFVGRCASPSSSSATAVRVWYVPADTRGFVGRVYSASPTGCAPAACAGPFVDRRGVAASVPGRCGSGWSAVVVVVAVVQPLAVQLGPETRPWPR